MLETTMMMTVTRTIRSPTKPPPSTTPSWFFLLLLLFLCLVSVSSLLRHVVVEALVSHRHHNSHHRQRHFQQPLQTLGASLLSSSSLSPPTPPSRIHRRRGRLPASSHRHRHHYCTSLGSKSYLDDLDGESDGDSAYGVENSSAKEEEDGKARSFQQDKGEEKEEEEFVVRRRRRKQQPRIRDGDNEYEYEYDYYDIDDDDVDDIDKTTYEINQQFPRRRDERNSNLSRYDYYDDYDYASRTRKYDDDDLMYDEYDDEYDDDELYDTDFNQDDFRGTSSSSSTSTTAAAASRDGGGNYWSNPTKRLDRPQQQQRRRRTSRSRTGGGANSNRRSSITMNPNASPTAFKNFYDRLFWSGFDPDDPNASNGGGGSSSVGDKTAFGGTKGKFNGLAFYRAAEENISNRDRPRRRSTTASSRRGNPPRQDYRSTNPNRLPLPPATFSDDDDDDDDDDIEDDERYDRSRLRKYYNYDDVEDETNDNDIDPYFDTADKTLGYDDETLSTRSRSANDAYQSGKFRPGNRTVTPPDDSPIPVNPNTTRRVSVSSQHPSSIDDRMSHPRIPERRRTSPARQRARSYQEDEDFYYNGEDEDDYMDRPRSRDNVSRRVSGRSSTNREERYADNTDNYFDDGDDFLPRDDESARRFQRRRQRSSKQDGFLGWSPKDALGNFIGSDWNRLADEYDSKMGLRRNSRSSPEQTPRQERSRRRQRQQPQPQRGAPPAGPRASFRDYPDRPGYAYRYDLYEEDDDEDTVVDIDTVDDRQSEFSDLPNDMDKEDDDVDNDNKKTDSQSSSDPDEKKELSWEERVLAVERVPPATVPAWGPQGELPMNARMKAVVDALQDIETARRKVKRRKKKKSMIEDDIAALKVDIKRDRLRLNQGGGRRPWELEEQLRENELEANELSLDLRKIKLQIEYAQAELDELQERHWAVLSFYSPELATSAVDEALGEFSGGGGGRGGGGRVGGSSPSASTTNGDTSHNNNSSGGGDDDDRTIAKAGIGDGTESPTVPATAEAADPAAAAGGGGPINGTIGVNGKSTKRVSSEASNKNK